MRSELDLHAAEISNFRYLDRQLLDYIDSEIFLSRKCELSISVLGGEYEMKTIIGKPHELLMFTDSIEIKDILNNLVADEELPPGVTHDDQVSILMFDWCSDWTTDIFWPDNGIEGCFDPRWDEWYEILSDAGFATGDRWNRQLSGTLGELRDRCSAGQSEPI